MSAYRRWGKRGLDLLALLTGSSFVLMAVLGDSAKLIRDARAALVIPPEDSGAIAKAVRQLSVLTPQQRGRLTCR